MKQVREARRIRTRTVPAATDRILPYTQDAAQIAVNRDFNHLVQLGLIRPTRKDQENKPLEQPISPKSWRKYQFNIIDSLTDISPEWRLMLKGRDLRTERYYSKENVEALRTIYRDKIYPSLWSSSATANPEEVKALRGSGTDARQIRPIRNDYENQNHERDLESNAKKRTVRDCSQVCFCFAVCCSAR